MSAENIITKDDVEKSADANPLTQDTFGYDVLDNASLDSMTVAFSTGNFETYSCC